LLKTIINELVKFKGEELRKNLTRIPVHTNPTLCSYLDLIFKQQQQQQQQETAAAAQESSAAGREYGKPPPGLTRDRYLLKSADVC
jgi:hypothetical protein